MQEPAALPCKHCRDKFIIPDSGQVTELVASIPIDPSFCADGDVYTARLEQCASCADLRGGVLCAWCGCFVQFRARIKDSYCPNPAGDSWNKPGNLETIPPRTSRTITNLLLEKQCQQVKDFDQ